MPDLHAALGDVQTHLDEAVDKRGLAGASLAVLHGDEIVEAASGVVSTRTRVDVTTDTLFQIGSVTKVYTATLVMQLVDAGLVDLDTPVRTYVPEFRVADAAATERITVRHLLSHTSGFDGGDHFVDTGRGDDCVARYVAALSDLEQLTDPGSRWSYNNAGFTVLGRLVEAITGQVWDDALRDRLLLPAGLTSSKTLPEDVLLFRAAAGHTAGEGGVPVPVRQWGMSRSSGPAGCICATARDVVGFVRLHLDGGTAASGEQLLSPGAVKAMQEPQIDLPGEGAAFGLGWQLGRVSGERTMGHNGGTLGQSAFMTSLPDRGFAIALLTNGPSGAAVWQDIAGHVFPAVLGVEAPKPSLPALPATPPQLDLTLYEGTYERRAVHTTFRVEDGALVAEMRYVDLPYDLKPPAPMALTPVDAETFVAMAGDEPAMAMRFLDFDGDGRPSLMFAARISKRRT